MTLERPSIFHQLGVKAFETAVGEMDVIGSENIPQKGPAILGCNHMGWAELPAVGLLVPQLFAVITKEENMRLPVAGNLLQRLGFSGVNRGEAAPQAIHRAIDMLGQNRFLFTPPEGTRGHDIDGTRLKLKPAKAGVAFIAIKAADKLGCAIPFIPIAVWGGTESVAPEIDSKNISLRSRIIWQRGPVHIRIAQPFYIQPRGKKTNMKEENLQGMVDAFMIAIRDMLPEKYHGYYAGMEPIAKPGDKI